jgi:Cupin-like domain
MSRDSFLQDFFRKRALHIDCTDATRIRRTFHLRHHLFDLDYETILTETSSESIFVWLTTTKNAESGDATKKNGKSNQKINNNNNNNNNNKSSSSLIQSIEVADAATALALHAAGHSTYCRAPPRVEQLLVSSLLRETGLGCGQYDPSGESNLCLGRGEVETFLSTTGHLTDWHFDFQENFTIQLSGSKKWTLMEGTIVDPLRGCTPHYQSPETVESQLKAGYLFDKKFMFGQPRAGVNAKGKEQSVILKPGDVLYFPAGSWHKVETLEPGVSINVSLMATNYAEIISRSVYHYLFRDARFRQPIINNSVTNSATDHLQELLKDLPTLVQRLCKPNGEGAQDILPPALQFPPMFREEDSDMSDEDDDDEEEDDDEDEDDGEENDDFVIIRQGGDNGEVDDGNQQDSDDDEEDSSDEDDEEEDFETLDPEAFLVYEPGWDFKLEMGSRIGLMKNPLSALHKLEEITSYYSSSSSKNKASGDGDTKKKDPGIFVLNVNYGGNEAHESSIRVQFRDNPEGMAERLWKLEREMSSDGKEDDDGLLEEIVVSEDNYHLISFLVYHGYMQVVAAPSNKK